MNDKGPEASHTPPQYFIEPDMLLGDRIILTGAPLKHARAQRLRPGEEFSAVLGGKVYTAEVVETSSDRLIAEVTGETELTPAGYKVHLFACMLKGQNFDLVVEKATEIGVSTITPVVSARTIPQLDQAKAEERRVRWQKVSNAASEQSTRGAAPVIGEVMPLSRVLDDARTALSGGANSGTAPLEILDFAALRHSRRWLLAYEHGEITVPLAQVLDGVTEVSILIGPEGGLDESETKAALSSGFIPVSLGPHIMKAETASIAAAALLVHYLSTGK